jgi:hypothetical protein
MSNRRKRGVKMSNLWFLWFLQECHRNSWELKLAHAHSGQPRLESLTKAVWTLIELCLTRAWVDIEARSEPVGVQGSRLYDGADHRTTHSSSCCSALAANARRDRALPSCLQAKQPADVDDREGITRPIASLTRSPWHLGCPIHKGALFFVCT